MATFALMIDGKVHELIQAADAKELATRYTPELVAAMVDVSGKDVRQHMVKSGDTFADPPVPEVLAPAPITAERLAALLVAKGVLAAGDLDGTKQ